MVTAAACAPKKAPNVGPDERAAARLAAADVQVRAGCFDCLVAAYRDYDALRQVSSTHDAATAGAIRAAALVALRQHELGMADDGYLMKARDLAVAEPNVPGWLPKILDIIDALPTASIGAGRPTNDADLEKSRRLRTNHDAWSAVLRESAGYDEAAAYAWLSLMCGAREARAMSREELFAPASTFGDTPLIGYREMTCRGVEPEKLEALLVADPRFVEITYVRGLFEVGRRELDEAERWFARAYAWHPQWPTLTIAMANVAMTNEEFDRALTLYDETLGFEPHAVDALLGRVRALTYLARHDEAIATVDRLLADRWYVGDARYWRAVNETELTRYDEAWMDIDAAAKLLINADVPKLAGIIAYRRHELEVARAKFDQSRERNRSDCETGYYLGIVLADEQQWPRTADVFTETARCLQSAEQQLKREIERIAASTAPPQRKARQIARREQQLASARRMLVTSWFNTAVAYYSLSRLDEARQYAEKVADDEQFGERARDLLSRLR